MGNEMGNNNVSGLKEEENKAAEAQKYSSQEGNDAEDVKWGNLEVPASEDKDFCEKAEGLHSNDLSRLDLKDNVEEQNKAAEGLKISSGEGNLAEDVRGENQEVPVSEDKNFHANAEKLHSNDSPRLDLREQNGFEPKSALQSIEVAIEPDNKTGQESGSQVISLAEEVNHLEKATEPKNEENMLGTCEDQMEERANFEREAEEVETSSSIHGIESASITMESSAPTTEESSTPNSNREEEALSSCQAEKKVLVETDGPKDLAESVLSSEMDGEKTISKTLREETASQEEVVATTTPDDQSDTATKDDEANVSSNVTLISLSDLDNKCRERVPTEIQLNTNGYYDGNSERTAEEVFKCYELVTEMDITGNGSSHENREITIEEVNKFNNEVPIPGMDISGNDSSNPPEEAISLINSPNTFEEVPEPQDRFTIVKEDIEVIGNCMLEIEDNKHHPGLVELHEQEVNGMKFDEDNSPETQTTQAGSAGDNEKNNTVDSSSDFSFQDNQSKDVKVYDQLESSSIEPDEESKESEELTEISPAIETVPTEITATGCQSKEAAEENNIIEEVETKAEKSKTPDSGTEAISSPAFGAVLTELTVRECQNGEDPTEKEANGEAEERAENSKAPESHIEAKETLQKPTSLQDNYSNVFIFESPTKAPGTNSNNESCPESEGRLSSESIPKHPGPDSELRKSPSFDFDLSLNATYEESDQTPLLIHDKAEKRSHSKSLDVSNTENTISQGKYGTDVFQYQPISVEEKTIKVERSDSDKSRAQIVGTPQKEEKQEVKDSCSEPSKEVAITKGSSKRKARHSLFTTCICCAAAIN